MTASALNLISGLLAATESEPSKTAFYVAGSLFAVWAVVLSAIGLRNADFPPTGTVARLVMTISLVGLLATASFAIATSTKPGKHEGEEATEATEAPASGEGSTVALAAAPSGELRFDKKEISAKAGKVTIDIDNPSDIPHNVAIEGDGEQLAVSDTVTKAKANATATLEAGTYTFYCAVAGHRQAGMEGKLTVE